MQKNKIVYIKSDYIDFLREIEPRVYYNTGVDGKSSRPYLGALLDINGLLFFAPFSSPKKRHMDIPNSCCTVFKLFEVNNYKNPLGAIMLSHMIPVSANCILTFNIKSHKDSILLDKQYKYIQRNKEDLIKKAQAILDHVIDKKTTFYVQKSCDFQKLIIRHGEYVSKSLEECSKKLNATQNNFSKK